MVVSEFYRNQVFVLNVMQKFFIVFQFSCFNELGLADRLTQLEGEVDLLARLFVELAFSYLFADNAKRREDVRRVTLTGLDLRVCSGTPESLGCSDSRFKIA